MCHLSFLVILVVWGELLSHCSLSVKGFIVELVCLFHSLSVCLFGGLVMDFTNLLTVEVSTCN